MSGDVHSGRSGARANAPSTAFARGRAVTPEARGIDRLDAGRCATPRRARRCDRDALFAPFRRNARRGRKRPASRPGGSWPSSQLPWARKNTSSTSPRFIGADDLVGLAGSLGRAVRDHPDRESRDGSGRRVADFRRETAVDEPGGQMPQTGRPRARRRAGRAPARAAGRLRRGPRRGAKSGVERFRSHGRCTE